MGSSHVGIPTDVNAAVDTATEEWCFLYGPSQDVISRTVGAMS
jgi:hypothetical protein